MVGILPRRTDADTALVQDLTEELAGMGPIELNLAVDVVRGLRNRLSSPEALEAVELAGPETVSRRMLQTIPVIDPNLAAYNRLIGPFYDTSALSDWLGVTRQAINQRIGRSLLGVYAEDGDVRYPSFQFLDDGRVIPKLMAACKVLHEQAGLDPWAQAQWVNAKAEELGNRSVADVLRDGDHDDVELALWFVRAGAARLAA